MDEFFFNRLVCIIDKSDQPTSSGWRPGSRALVSNVPASIQHQNTGNWYDTQGPGRVSTGIWNIYLEPELILQNGVILKIGLTVIDDKNRKFEIREDPYDEWDDHFYEYWKLICNRVESNQ